MFISTENPDFAIKKTIFQHFPRYLSLTFSQMRYVFFDHCPPYFFDLLAYPPHLSTYAMCPYVQ